MSTAKHLNEEQLVRTSVGRDERQGLHASLQIRGRQEPRQGRREHFLADPHRREVDCRVIPFGVECKSHTII